MAERFEIAANTVRAYLVAAGEPLRKAPDTAFDYNGVPMDIPPIVKPRV